MSGALKFLYGIVLGISLGIIGSRLAAAASSHSQRQPAGDGRRRQRPAQRPRRREKTPAA